MAKIISLSAVILNCILLAFAESPINSYSVNGENNGFEYNNNVINGAYMAGKEGHGENTDFYGGRGSGHSLTNGRSQGNLEESLRSNSYNGFSPSTHNTGFLGYSTGSRESLASSPYFVNNAAQSGYDTYTSSNSNGDSTFEAYTQGTDQVGSDFSQFSSANKQKSPTYSVRFSDNLSGASSTGSYPELATEGSPFKGEYSSDSLRNHAAHSAGFMEGGDQTYNRETSNLFNNPSNDYLYGKHKDGAFGVGGSNKFMSDVYSVHPDTRYVRVNHGNAGRDHISSMFLSNSGNSPFSSVRGSSPVYGSGKFNKYNKYMGEYVPSMSLNYLSKDQDVDYLYSNYGKGNGKLAGIKESRPSSYNSQSYLGGPSYVNKIVGSYKSKPSFVNSYPSSPPIGYSSMPALHSSFSGNSYSDNPVLRRYRSSSSYVPGHTNTYSGYF